MCVCWFINNIVISFKFFFIRFIYCEKKTQIHYKYKCKKKIIKKLNLLNGHSFTSMRKYTLNEWMNKWLNEWIVYKPWKINIKIFNKHYANCLMFFIIFSFIYFFFAVLQQMVILKSNLRNTRNNWRVSSTRNILYMM